MRQRALPLLLVACTLSWAGLFGAHIIESEDLLGRMLKSKPTEDVPWAFFTQDEILDGVTIPANTNVVFTLPTSLSPTGYITREVLLGNMGKKVRYWGYCFPKPTIGKNTKANSGLPGDVFLSEAERAYREAAVKSYLKETYSPTRPPSDMLKLSPLSNSPIRHKKELFYGGETCYIMTPRALAMGSDLDGDDMNIMTERDAELDPENPDSDGDGMGDGLEAYRYGTNPRVFDTDNDGIGDAIEDANRNGRRDVGETSALNADSDNDGLCDGLCPLGMTEHSFCPETADGGNCITVSPQYLNVANADDDNPEDFNVIKAEYWAGEDRNRNGVVDGGETDPRTPATFDGQNDLDRYLECGLSNDGDLTDC